MTTHFIQLNPGARARLCIDGVYMALLRLVTASPELQVHALALLKKTCEAGQDPLGGPYGSNPQLIMRYKAALQGVIAMLEYSLGISSLSDTEVGGEPGLTSSKPPTTQNNPAYAKLKQLLLGKALAGLAPKTDAPEEGSLVAELEEPPCTDS